MWPETLSGWGGLRSGKAQGRQALSLTHAQNPLPCCGDSWQRKARHGNGHKDQVPRGFGVRFCKLANLWMSLRHVMGGRRAPTAGLVWGDDRKCA